MKLLLFTFYEGTPTLEDRPLKRTGSSTLDIDKHIKRVTDLYSI